MTETLTTRGPFNENPGLLVRWMLKSGEENRRPIGDGARAVVRDGIRLYIPTEGGVAVLELADVHEAGDLYVALEAHMENIADGQERAGGVGPVEEARSMGEEERRAMTPNVPRTWTPVAREGVTPYDWREANLKAVQEQIDNPIPVKSRVQDPYEQVDAEFLGAMADVVEVWTAGKHWHHGITPADAQSRVRTVWPELAAALDRLAALSA